MSSSTTATKPRMPIALYALTVTAFGIGTTEFVIMGLLPEVARDLSVSIPSAGLLVTGYALGVVVGAPTLTALTAGMERKRLLLMLVVIFILGNVLCAVAWSYSVLMTARVITAFAHGAFFGVGSVVATRLVPKDRQAAAIAIMFTGSTLANILGVPAGTLLGQNFGWRSTFWVVAVLGAIAAVGTLLLVPKVENHAPSSFRIEVRALARRQVQLALLMTVLGYGGVFTAFTYIAPLLTDVTGYSASSVGLLLVLFGAGLFLGNILAGKAADRALMPTLYTVLTLLALVLAALTLASHDKLAMAVVMFLLGGAAFGTVPPLQMRVLSEAGDAPAVASASNIAAFNLGNAGGAFLGGRIIAGGLGLPALGWVAALVTLSGLAVAVYSGSLDRRRDTSHLATATTGATSR
ncbi:MFS transporter [Micromonospora fluostatini]